MNLDGLEERMVRSQKFNTALVGIRAILADFAFGKGQISLQAAKLRHSSGNLLLRAVESGGAGGLDVDASACQEEEDHHNGDGNVNYSA